MLSFINNVKLISKVTEDYYIYAEFENNITSQSNAILGQMLDYACFFIQENTLNEKNANLSYTTKYVFDEAKPCKNIILEADILVLTKDKLVADCYLFDRVDNLLLAKSFMVFKINTINNDNTSIKNIL